MGEKTNVLGIKGRATHWYVALWLIGATSVALLVLRVLGDELLSSLLDVLAPLALFASR